MLQSIWVSQMSAIENCILVIFLYKTKTATDRKLSQSWSLSLKQPFLIVITDNVAIFVEVLSLTNFKWDSKKI